MRRIPRKTQTLHVRLSEHVVESLDRLAAAESETISIIVRRMIAAGLREVEQTSVRG